MQSRRHRACPAVTVASTLRLPSWATRTGSRSRRRSASRSSVECSYLRGIRYREVLHQMHRRRVVSLIPRLSLSADVRSTRSHPAAELEREPITEGTRAPPRLRPRAWTRRRAQAQMTAAKLRLAMASMGKRETNVGALCEELGITPQSRKVTEASSRKGAHIRRRRRQMRS